MKFKQNLFHICLGRPFEIRDDKWPIAAIIDIIKDQAYDIEDTL